MRKVKYFIAIVLILHRRPDGAVEWLFNDGTDYGMAEFFRSIDAVLLGRKTYDFATGKQAKPKQKNKKTKRNGAAGWGMKSYVFSRTLKLEPDEDLTIVSESAGEFVRELKNQPARTSG